MRFKTKLDPGECYVAGKRGVRFRNDAGDFQLRKAGEPVPEAINFKNIQLLLQVNKLAIVKMKVDEVKVDEKPAEKKQKKLLRKFLRK